MSEITYVPEVRCKTTGGIREDGVTAQLTDVDGRSQFVQVTEGLINRAEGQAYLSVGFVEIDRRARKVLVELPTEADSGANRMWVRFEDLRQETGVPA